MDCYDVGFSQLPIFVHGSSIPLLKFRRLTRQRKRCLSKNGLMWCCRPLYHDSWDWTLLWLVMGSSHHSSMFPCWFFYWSYGHELDFWHKWKKTSFFNLTFSHCSWYFIPTCWCIYNKPILVNDLSVHERIWCWINHAIMLHHLCRFPQWQASTKGNSGLKQ